MSVVLSKYEGYYYYYHVEYIKFGMECIVADGTKWRSAVKQHLKTEEDVISATKAVTPAFVSLQPQSTL